MLWGPLFLYLGQRICGHGGKESQQRVTHRFGHQYDTNGQRSANRMGHEMQTLFPNHGFAWATNNQIECKTRARTTGHWHPVSQQALSDGSGDLETIRSFGRFCYPSGLASWSTTEISMDFRSCIGFFTILGNSYMAKRGGSWNRKVGHLLGGTRPAFSFGSQFGNTHGYTKYGYQNPWHVTTDGSRMCILSCHQELLLDGFMAKQSPRWKVVWRRHTWNDKGSPTTRFDESGQRFLDETKSSFAVESGGNLQEILSEAWSFWWYGRMAVNATRWWFRSHLLVSPSGSRCRHLIQCDHRTSRLQWVERLGAAGPLQKVKDDGEIL